MADKNEKAPKTIDPAMSLNPDSDLPPDADVEERFNDFWKKNGPGIFGGIALGAVLVTGVQIYKYMGTQKEDAIRANFAEAVTESEKRSFAEANSDHELAGLARLSIADSRFSAGDYVDAGALYSDASETLTGTPLHGRAVLGQGISLLLAGEVAGGQSVLEGLALNSSAIDGVRAEAAYHLAVSRWEAGDFEGVQAAIDLISGLDGSSIWAMRAVNLQNRIPELAGLNK